MNEEYLIKERAWNRTIYDFKKHNITGLAYNLIWNMGRSKGYNLTGYIPEEVK